VIKVDTSQAEVKELRYEKNEKDLKIYLSLKRGGLREKDISFNFLNPKTELLIILGAKNRESLGSFFEKNPQLFYQLPILNIDHQPGNENFGSLNLIDLTSPSLCQIVSALIEEIDPNLIDQDVATYLLTGLISATQNFQSPKTTPQTLELASSLMERGASHQKIIQHLYKTSSLSQIKLLGQILEKLNFDPKRELYYVTLKNQDFREISSSPSDLTFVVEELKAGFFRLPAFLILWESHSSQNLIKGILFSPKREWLIKILENLEGIQKGEGVLFLVRDSDLSLAKDQIFEILS
jgi:hypothetical protein